jgi:hypothetical protein
VDLPSWILGLSLIVLTVAIHTTRVVLMALEAANVRQTKLLNRIPSLIRIKGVSAPTRA